MLVCGPLPRLLHELRDEPDPVLGLSLIVNVFATKVLTWTFESSVQRRLALLPRLARSDFPYLVLHSLCCAAAVAALVVTDAATCFHFEAPLVYRQEVMETTCGSKVQQETIFGRLP